MKNTFQAVAVLVALFIALFVADSLLQEGRREHEIPRPKTAERPVLPPIPPLRDAQGREDLSLRARFLIEHNPVEGVADLLPLIDARQFGYALVPNNPAMAYFGLVPGWDIGFGSGTLYPSIIVDERLVRAADTEDLMLELMTVVGHEYVHYLQWRDGDDATRHTFLPRGPGDLPTESDCRHNWHQEFEAYVSECEHYVAWRVNGHYSQHCEGYVSRESFKSRFAPVMMSRPLAQICGQVWTEEFNVTH